MGRLELIRDWIERAREAGYRAEALARICEVSGSHLRRHFTAFGRPPQEWLDELRLCRAMEMVCAGSPTKVVAAELNFRDACHFCKRFKKYHGCTPQQFVRKFKDRLTSRLAAQGEMEILLTPWQEAERALASQLHPRRLAVNTALRTTAHPGA